MKRVFQVLAFAMFAVVFASAANFQDVKIFRYSGTGSITPQNCLIEIQNRIPNPSSTTTNYLLKFKTDPSPVVLDITEDVNAYITLRGGYNNFECVQWGHVQQ